MPYPQAAGVLLLLTASAAADISVADKPGWSSSAYHCFNYDASGNVDYTSNKCDNGQYCNKGTCQACPLGYNMNSGTSNGVANHKGLDQSWCVKAAKGSKSFSGSHYDLSNSARYPGILQSNTAAIKHVLNMYPTLLLDPCTGANQFQDEAGQSTCKTCPTGKVGAKPHTQSDYDQLCNGDSDAVTYNEVSGRLIPPLSTTAMIDRLCKAKAEAGWNQGNTRCVSCDTSAADGGPGVSDAITEVQGGVENRCQASRECNQGEVKKQPSTCYQCPQGKYTKQEDCTPLGKECSKCTDCPAGKTTNGAGSHLAEGVDPKTDNTVCQPYSCQNGYYCPGGTPPFVCAVGTYSGAAPFKSGSCDTTCTIEVGISSCSTCSSGTSGPGATKCTAASVGFERSYTSGNSWTPTDSAVDGTYVTSGTDCALGYFKDGDDCTPCANGTFSNVPGADECQKCPEGYVSGQFGAISGAARGGRGADWEAVGAIAGATTCSTCGEGSHMVVNGSNCSFCEPGSTKFQPTVGVTWEDVGGPYEKGLPYPTFMKPGPSCWKCGPGHFSNGSTVTSRSCSSGSDSATGNWLTQGPIDTKGENGVANGDLHTRAVCQAVLGNYALGGACLPCPAGQVSAQRFGSTSCMTCPPGTFPSSDRGSCVTESVMAWVILCVLLLIAFICLAPCMEGKKYTFVLVKGYRLKTAHVFLFIAFIVALGVIPLGVEKRQFAAFVTVGLFLVACIPAWCAALFPMEEGLPKQLQQTSA